MLWLQHVELLQLLLQQHVVVNLMIGHECSHCLINVFQIVISILLKLHLDYLSGATTFTSCYTLQLSRFNLVHHVLHQLSVLTEHLVVKVAEEFCVAEDRAETDKDLLEEPAEQEVEVTSIAGVLLILQQRGRQQCLQRLREVLRSDKLRIS